MEGKEFPAPALAESADLNLSAFWWNRVSPQLSPSIPGSGGPVREPQHSGDLFSRYGSSHAIRSRGLCQVIEPAKFRWGYVRSSELRASRPGWRRPLACAGRRNRLPHNQAGRLSIGCGGLRSVELEANAEAAEEGGFVSTRGHHQVLESDTSGIKQGDLGGSLPAGLASCDDVG